MHPIETLERLGENFALDPASEKKKMLVIVNPYATTVSDRLRNLVVYALQARYEVTAIDTKERNHATALAREAAHEGYDVVVAFGGDGTLNEAANGLAGSDTPLTMLPGGATNVFAKLLGIPGEIVDATEHLLHVADDWHPRKVDLARVNDRLFTFTSGLGLDAEVVKRVDEHPKLKTRYGAGYFTYKAITTFFGTYVINPPRMTVELPDGTSFDGVSAIVQNADKFTFYNDRPLHVARGATLESRDLAGIVLKRTTPTIMPSVMARILLQNLEVTKHRAIEGFSGVDGLVVRAADEPLALQVDGDYIGDVEEARFEVLPGALTVVA
jgi:diacylglycerol kinase family enzyme